MKKYDQLTNEDALELAFLQHAKSNVVSSSDQKSQALEKALKYYTETAPNLYRGLYKQELEGIGKLQPGKVISFNRYTSFSENLNTATAFGGGTKTVIFLKGGKGFNYSKFMIKYLNSLNIEDFEMMDGETLLRSLKSEQEWILPIKAKYKIDEVKTSDSGYTVIGCFML